MFEIYYAQPADPDREIRLAHQLKSLGGRLEFREESEISDTCNHVCLTFEFEDRKSAEQAIKLLREQGEHVEGPGEYGDD